MSIMNKECLYTTVRNTSGGAMKFGFLPPHGVELANGEEYTVFGSIVDAFGRGNPGGERRAQQSFGAALDAGLITIVRTPAPILLDTATYASKMLTLTGGTLGTADPCWDTVGESISEHRGEFPDNETPA